MPWKAPSPNSATHEAVSVDITTSRETVGIRTGVAAFEVDLVRTHAVELEESVLGDAETAGRAHVHLREPAPDAVGIELLVPRAIERVGHVEPLSVAADLHHLRPAIQRL